MPPHFTFKKAPTGQTIFEGDLECRRCAYVKTNSEQCKRRSCKQLPYCFQHVKTVYGVEIKESTIPGAGLGLIAAKDFKKGDFIAPVLGERLTAQQLNHRYSTAPGATMPYTIRVGEQDYDGALMRYSGQYANSLFNNRTHRSKLTGTNAVFSRKRVENEWQPWIRSTKAIKKGQEVLAYYGNEYMLQDEFVSQTR